MLTSSPPGLVSARSVLFDTETTGLDPMTGDRIIEIALLELVRDLPTGTRLHLLIDPERDIPEEATRVHGMTRADLRGKPRFADVAEQILEFIGDDALIAHNAPFDFGFMDAEFSRAGHPKLLRGRMVCTLALAKTRFPGLPNSLDALCRRFGVDLTERVAHNALLDCRLLAEVYIELTGGRQRGLSLMSETGQLPTATYQFAGPRSARAFAPGSAAFAQHAAFIGRIKTPVWLE